MNILLPYVALALPALSLLPVAICVFLVALKEDRHLEYIAGESKLANVRLRGCMSSLEVQLGAIQRELERLALQSQYHDMLPAGPTPASVEPAPESTPAPAEFVAQLSPNQLSILLRGLGMQAGVELPPFLQAAPPVLLDSLQGSVEHAPQEPEISHGGE